MYVVHGHPWVGHYVLRGTYKLICIIANIGNNIPYAETYYLLRRI